MCAIIRYKKYIIWGVGEALGDSEKSHQIIVPKVPCTDRSTVNKLTYYFLLVKAPPGSNQPKI